ncbi:MAG TPA: hypothetical protein VKT72_16465 [Candidatus Baltobacteraceae bacterium]|nr:hypothetical protein [Candidatus Baltobacteraceae bacterium]
MNGFVDAATGFAADAQGKGIAYVRVHLGGTPRVLRVPFGVKRYPALRDREIGYAALTEVGAALHRRGIQRVRFTVDDARLADDLREHRDVPAPLTLAYVRVRCALNQFKEYEVAATPSGESDLTARARSEVAMHVAA